MSDEKPSAPQALSLKQSAPAQHRTTIVVNQRKKNAIGMGPATLLWFCFFIWSGANESGGQVTTEPGSHSQEPWVITDFDDAGGPFDCCKDHCVWTSDVFSLQETSEALLSANIECVGIGEFETADFITISYRFDKDDWTPLITLRDDFERSTFSASLKSDGENVQLKIEAQTSSSNEIYKVHRLSLQAAASSRPPSFPPDKSIDPKAGMQTAQGTLIIDGGNMKRKPNQPTVKEFVKYAGGLDQPVVVSPTASQEVTETDWKEYSDSWKEAIGFKHVSFMHSVNRDPAEANTDAFVEDLKKARGLFMRGGRQWRLVDAYGNADQQTKTLKEMWKLLERDGVIAGTSAGATIQGDFMPRGFTGGSGRMISRESKHRQGFAFLPNVAFDVHVSARSRTTDLHEVLAYANKRGEDLIGIGIDEDTAIVVRGKVFRVIGSGRVFVHTFMNTDKGNQILILKTGDQYNLSTREKFVPAPQR